MVAVKLVHHRDVVYETLREAVVAGYEWVCPKPPETVEPPTPVYMSDEARDAIKQANATSSELNDEQPADDAEV